MSIRTPLRTAKQIVETALTGTLLYTFNVDQDIDNLVCKMSVGTFTGTSPTADIYIQTTDDGGTTWYDMGHFAQVTTAITNANALWMTIPVNGTSAVSSSTTSNGYTGAAADASISASKVSGIPVLNNLVRVKVVYGGTVGVNVGITINIYESSQASHQ